MGKQKGIFDKKNLEILREVLEMYLEDEYNKVKIIEHYEFSDEFKKKINDIIENIL